MGAVNLGQVAAFIDSVSVEPLAQGAAPYVRNDGTTSNAQFVFGLPTDSGAAAEQARQAANDSRADSLKSEGYALGTQGGTAVTDTSPYYHNNSKYYSEQSSDSATAAAAAEERTRTMLSTKQDVLTFDTEPTAGSSNPVTSGGVYAAIASLGGYKVVPSLQSVTDPDEKTIYLVKDSTATGEDKYEEYIWQVDQGVGAWQKIGDTSLDLSDYIKNTDLATANTAGIVKPDGSTITVDANGVISGASLTTFDQDDFDETQGEVSLAPEQRIFTGTKAEWEALTSSQKAEYGTVHLTDDDNFSTVLYADTPIGVVQSTFDTSAPDGWLLLQGQTISRAEYSELLEWAVAKNLIGSGKPFGAGDGSTTFVLPDCREATLKGAGLTSLSNTHYDSDGLSVGEFIDDRIKEHQHNYSYFLTDGRTPQQWASLGSGYHDHEYLGTTTTAGSGATTEVKAIGVNYIIKAKQVALPADLNSAVDRKVEEEVARVVAQSLANYNKKIKYKDVEITNITVGADGYYDINSYFPSGMNNFLFATMWNYGNVTSRDCLTICANGSFIAATGNATISRITIRYFYTD